MRKGKLICCITAGSLLLLTGCGASLPEMTAEQEDKIVEYAASVVLDHMNNYDSRLVDLSLYEEQEEPEPTENPNKMDEVADTPVIDNSEESNTSEVPEGSEEQAYGTIEELLVPEGITIAYNGFIVADSYPADGSGNPYFALDASEGKDLLVLQFTMQNTSDMEKEVDIISLAPRCKVVVNGTEKSNILSTMLLDDLSTYIGTLPAGETVELVLIAEIKDEISGTVESVQLQVKTEEGSVTTLLQ